MESEIIVCECDSFPPVFTFVTVIVGVAFNLYPYKAPVVREPAGLSDVELEIVTAENAPLL